MRKLTISTIIIILLAAITLLLMQQKPSVPNPASPSTQQDLPWQIELVDGDSKVFGLTLGKSRLADAVKNIGPDFELAIISKPGQPEALELYTSSFKSGSLRGSLILVADISADDIRQLRDQFELRQEHLESGAQKTTLRFEQQQAALPYPIKSITFIPVARLDKTLVEQRFGQAHLTLVTGEKVNHYLYPERGLNIIIDEAGKDFIQYVSPRAFADFHQEIRQQADKYSHSLRAE